MEILPVSSSNSTTVGRKAHLLEDKQIPSVGVFDEVSFYTLFRENFDQGQKEWDKPFKSITEQELATLRAQANELFGIEKVWFEIPRCIAWDKVDNLSPQSTPQVLLSFEEYTLNVTYPEEVEDTLGTPIEVEPLNQTQVEDIGLNTCNDDIPLSFREVLSFDEPKPQPHPLPNCPSLEDETLNDYLLNDSSSDHGSAYYWDDDAASSSHYQVSECFSTKIEQVFPTFQQGEDLIDCINKAMAFLSAVASRFPPSNNQLRTSSNPRNQATIQDGRVTVQQIQGRPTQSFVGSGNRGIATTSRGNYASSQPRTKDLDTYDSDCDDLTSAKAVLMANLSSCDLDVLSEVPYFDTYPNDIINQDESQDAVIQDTNSSAPNDLLVLSLVEQMTDHLNKIKEDFGKRLVTQKELFSEQAFWLKHSNYNLDTSVKSHTPVTIEAPSEIPRVSLVNESLKKPKHQLASFDKVMKKRTKSDAITADEIIEVQTVFNQMEAAIDQCSVDKNAFEIQIKQLRIDNDQLLKQIMSQEIVHIAVNSMDILDVKK
ncbi:hypothetical protein Tco_0428752 [Tanacetum coccineum]